MAGFFLMLFEKKIAPPVTAPLSPLSMRRKRTPAAKARRNTTIGFDIRTGPYASEDGKVLSQDNEKKTKKRSAVPRRRSMSAATSTRRTSLAAAAGAAPTRQRRSSSGPERLRRRSIVAAAPLSAYGRPSRGRALRG